MFFPRTSAMAYTLLQDHKVDAVHRLIELLLRFDMRQECRRCLSFLFEYQCNPNTFTQNSFTHIYFKLRFPSSDWRRDLRACSEIMRNSLDNNLPLADIYQQKLLNLLLGGGNVPATDIRRPAHKPGAKFELRF